MNNPLLFEEIVSSLRVLSFDKLPSEWVDSAWEGNFMEFDENLIQDSDLISGDFSAAINNCLTHLRRYINSETDTGIWRALENEGYSPRLILAYIFVFVEVGLLKDADFTQQIRALKASEFYFCLCAIPGALAFNIFHGILFQRGVDCLKLTQKYLLAAPTVKGKKSKGKSAADSAYGDTSLQGTDRTSTIANLLSEILSGGLWLFLEKVSLKESKEALRPLVSNLVENVSFQSRDARFTSPATDRLEMAGRNLTEQIFCCLHQIAGPRHDVGARITLGKRGLLGKLLMLEGTSGSTISAAVQKERTLAMEFISELLKRDDEQIMETIYTVTQNLCAQVPDKSEFRKAVAQQVQVLLAKTPPQVGEKFVGWLELFSKTSKGSYRGFAVDLAGHLVELLPSLDRRQEATETLLRIVWDRCHDKSPTVRSRALTALGNFLNNPAIDLVRDLEPYLRSKGEEFHEGKPIFELLISLLQSRCPDEKSVTRKSAVVACEAAATAIAIESTRNQLWRMIAERCCDKGLLVRKQATESITRLLKGNMQSDLLMDLWLGAIMPLVTDREPAVQEKAVEALGEMIFKKIAATGAEEQLAWALLNKIESQLGFKRYLERALKCLSSGAPNTLSPRIISFLEAGTREAERSGAAWLLLSELCELVKLDPRMARMSWLTAPDTTSRSIAYMAKILGKAANRLSVDDIEEIVDDMKMKLERFEVSPENTGAIIYSLSQLLRISESEEAMGLWCSRMVEKCEAYLRGIIYDQATDVEPDEIISRLFSLGEVIQYNPKLASEELFTLVEALIASDRILAEVSTFQKTHHTQNNKSEHQDAHARSLLLKEGGPSAAIRAHAITTLGKLCLQDEESAKKCVAALIRELTTNRNTYVRNNTIVIIADLCIRYTSLIDRHIEAVSSCLKDPSLLVRKQTLILLTSLLKEDFLRFRGVLLYRFISMLLDGETAIRDFAEYCITKVLLVRHPDMFANHFLECLYFFNGVRHASWHEELEEPSTVSAMFSLKGAARKDDRMKLYKFMLGQFRDAQKLTTSMKITTDILDSVGESIPLNKDTEFLIADAFEVLSCKEIKATAHLASSADDEDETPAAAAQREATKNVISQSIKKATIEVVFPIVINLKALLEQKKHPLLKYLMAYLREAMKDYRNEIEEILVSDKRLAEEIEYDLRRFEDEEEERQRRLERQQAEQPTPSTAPLPTIQEEGEVPEPSNGVGSEENVEPVAPTATVSTDPAISESVPQSTNPRRSSRSSGQGPRSEEAGPPENVATGIARVSLDAPTIENDRPATSNDKENAPDELGGFIAETDDLTTAPTTPLPRVPETRSNNRTPTRSPLRPVPIDSSTEAPEVVNVERVVVKQEPVESMDEEGVQGMEGGRKKSSTSGNPLSNRAISTPSQSQLPELTFQLGGDYSCIPNLSPVQSTPKTRASQKRKLPQSIPFEDIPEDES